MPSTYLGPGHNFRKRSAKPWLKSIFVKTTSLVFLPARNPEEMCPRYSETSLDIRLRTIREKTLRTLFKRNTGLRLERGPRGLFGFANGTRIPRPMISEKSRTWTIAVLRKVAIKDATTLPPFLSSSLGILSSPQAFRLLRRWSAFMTSGTDIGVFNSSGGGDWIAEILTGVNC